MKSPNGWTMQLNAYSAKGSRTAYQQYVILVEPDGQVSWIINNWAVSKIQIMFDTGPQKLYHLPSTFLDTSWKLGITLAYGTNGVVNGAVFSIVDSSSHVVASQTVAIDQSLPVVLPNNWVFDPSMLAAMTGFEVNIVGPGGGSATVFNSGSGALEYVSSATLQPNPVMPATCTDYPSVGREAVTAENSNIEYAGVSPGKDVVQGFMPNLNLALLQQQTIRPVIRVPRKLRS